MTISLGRDKPPLFTYVHSTDGTVHVVANFGLWDKPIRMICGENIKTADHFGLETLDPKAMTCSGCWAPFTNTPWWQSVPNLRAVAELFVECGRRDEIIDLLRVPHHFTVDFLTMRAIREHERDGHSPVGDYPDSAKWFCDECDWQYPPSVVQSLREMEKL